MMGKSKEGGKSKTGKKKGSDLKSISLSESERRRGKSKSNTNAAGVVKSGSKSRSPQSKSKTPRKIKSNEQLSGPGSPARTPDALPKVHPEGISPKKPPSKIDKKAEKEPPKEPPKKAVEEGSIFEPIAGGYKPAYADVNGAKQNLRFKIDVSPLPSEGDNKMAEVVAKLRAKRAKAAKHEKGGMSKEKAKKAPKESKETVPEKDKEKEDDSEALEADIILAARVLMSVKIGKIIEKELTAAEQEKLKDFCRISDENSEIDKITEKVASAAMAAIVTKSDMCRWAVAQGELRMFAVEEVTARTAIQSLLLVRKDLLYVSWQKVAEVAQEDGTWSQMKLKTSTITGPEVGSEVRK